MFEGCYTRQLTLCNMQPHWTNMSKTYSIWFENGRWNVGYTSYLGTYFGLVIGPYGEEDWPQNITSGWTYYDGENWIDAGTDVIFGGSQIHW